MARSPQRARPFPEGSFAMHMREAGDARDCEEFPLPEPVEIVAG
ncbi:hypothetical protein [Azospirillum sp. SYSU D00513]|nr:hypothetical protein [Azospirillum sp. SYSU D00513]